jgi:hypothetical protein
MSEPSWQKSADTHSTSPTASSSDPRGFTTPMEGTVLPSASSAASANGSGGSSGGVGSGGGAGSASGSTGSGSAGGNAAGGSVSVDTDQLAQAVPAVTALSMRLAAINASLSGTIMGLGEPWGGKDDSIGGPFGQAYEPARDQILTGLSGTQQALESTADGLGTMVKGYTSTEDANTIPDLGAIGSGDDGAVGDVGAGRRG